MNALALHLAKKIFRALPLSDRQRTGLAFAIFRLTGDRLKHLPSYRLYLRDRKWHNAKVPDHLPAYRARMMAAHFSAEQGRAMLMVSHTLGGGTEQHVEDLAARLEAEGWRIFHLQRHNQDHLRLVASRFERGEPLFFRWPDELVALTETLKALGVAHLHLHHTLDLPAGFLAHFGEIARAAGTAYDYTAHDYFSICPRFTLFDEAVRGYCGEPSDPRKCSACVRHQGSAAGKEVDIGVWRGEYAALLAGARRVFVPDEDVVVRLARYFPAQTFTVRPHPEWAEIQARAGGAGAQPQHPLKVVTIGGIAPHKGSGALLLAAEEAQKRNLPVEFTLIGFSDIDHKLKALGNMTVTGPFQPEELAQRLQKGGFHLAFLPSVIPETYNYVLSECWRHGLFTVCFDIGAIASRIKAAPGLGAVMPLEWYFQPEKLNDYLLRLEIPPVDPQVVRAQLRDYPSATRDYYGL